MHKNMELITILVLGIFENINESCCTQASQSNALNIYIVPESEIFYRLLAYIGPYYLIRFTLRDFIRSTAAQFL